MWNSKEIVRVQMFTHSVTLRPATLMSLEGWCVTFYGPHPSIVLTNFRKEDTMTFMTRFQLLAAVRTYTRTLLSNDTNAMTRPATVSRERVSYFLLPPMWALPFYFCFVLL